MPQASEEPMIRKNYKTLARLLKNLVAERFKRMAKDEVLSRFISSRIDPALLVDHALQAEKEALDLAEMSLLKLVSSDQMRTEIFKSAEKIQSNLQEVFGSAIGGKMVSETLVELRAIWLGARIEF